MSDQVPESEPRPEASPYSFGSAYEALEDLITAIPRTRRGAYVGHFNEIGVVLTGAAGLLGIVRYSEGWRTEIGKLPRKP